jgi:myo-inositol-1(or 4)-monophosphatase
MQLAKLRETAVEIAREAGAKLRDGYGKPLEIEKKTSSFDWVTQYDKACEALIVQRLTVAFPKHGIIGEEGTNRAGDGRFFWIIDPLDGTTNFAHRFPVFSVSIALYEGSASRIGVIYDPLRDECFIAAAGLGAELRSGDRSHPCAVSQAAVLGHSLLGTGFPYDRQNQLRQNLPELSAFLPHIQGIRRAGSAALDLAYVAAGRLDGYWEFKLNSWDIAAGILLIQEAGGQVTGMNGDPLQLPPFGDDQSGISLLASNGRIHTMMQEKLQAAAG